MEKPYFEIDWNPVTGCSEVSEGCKNCFGIMYAPYLQKIGIPAYHNGFQFTIHEKELARIKKISNIPAVIIPCRMSDLFQPQVPDNIIKEVLSITSNPVGILTKHASRLLNYDFPENYYVCVTVETPNHYDRIDHLASVRAKYKGLYLTPLISPHPKLRQFLKGIDSVTLYEERGPNARPCDPAWVEDIISQCNSAGVRVVNYFKNADGGAPLFYRRALALQLFDPLPGGLIGVPTMAYPRAYEYAIFYYNMNNLSDEEIISRIKKRTPEFFEP